MVHRILKKHEPVIVVNEDESLTKVLTYWENNDPDHTWEVLCLALLKDRVYKELGASLYSKHVKPEEFTLDLVYEEIKDLTTDPQEIAYVLVEDSKQLCEIWGDSVDKLSFEERTKLAINHWMINNPASSWLLLAKRLEWYIHGENEIAAQEIATKIRDKYLLMIDERAYGPPQDPEDRKLLGEFSADEAFKELSAVEDWFGLGWFLKIEEDELKEIERNYGHDDDRKLAMLRLWVDTQRKTASWNNLAFAVKKMPQHQSLAQDIEDKLFEKMQDEIREEHLKELYTQFFAKLIVSLCDDQTHSSLVDQLTSLSLISETDKETQLSSAQDPRQRAASLLLLLNIEEKPQHIIELVRAMKGIDEMKSLADEMAAQYRAMEGTSEMAALYEAMSVQHGAIEESVQYKAMEGTSEMSVQTMKEMSVQTMKEMSVQTMKDTSEMSVQYKAMKDHSLHILQQPPTLPSLVDPQETDSKPSNTLDHDLPLHTDQQLTTQLLTSNPQVQTTGMEPIDQQSATQPFTLERVAREPSNTLSTTPTLLKLRKMKGADGKPLNIIKEISSKDYVSFGEYLLKDENGTAVDLLEKDHIHKGAKSVTRAILQQWLTSTVAPRTYQHLIDCLRQTDGLDGLAELIEETL